MVGQRVLPPTVACDGCSTQPFIVVVPNGVAAGVETPWVAIAPTKAAVICCDQKREISLTRAIDNAAHGGMGARKRTVSEARGTRPRRVLLGYPTGACRSHV